MEGPDLSEGDMTRSESVYACNFAICTNKDRLQRPDTKAPKTQQSARFIMPVMRLPE